MGVPRLSRVIIDGIHYDQLPETFEPDYGSYGVEVASSELLDSGRLVVVDAPPTIDGGGLRARKLRRQAWRMGFGDSSPAFVRLVDHLETLHTTQRGFWVQFDAEMSRDFGIILNHSDPNVFYTPTWPVFPYGHEPGDPIDWKGAFVFNGGAQNVATSYAAQVDMENGVVTFPPPVNPFGTQVRMRYTWRCYVHIAAFERAVKDSVNQSLYRVAATLEQLSMPALSTLFWNLHPYEGQAIDSLRRGASGAISIESAVTMRKVTFVKRTSASGSIRFPDQIAGLAVRKTVPGRLALFGAEGKLRFDSQVTVRKAEFGKNRGAHGSVRFHVPTAPTLRKTVDVVIRHAGASGTLILGGDVAVRKNGSPVKKTSATGDVTFSGSDTSFAVYYNGVRVRDQTTTTNDQDNGL